MALAAGRGRWGGSGRRRDGRGSLTRGGGGRRHLARGGRYLWPRRGLGRGGRARGFLGLPFLEQIRDFVIDGDLLLTLGGATLSQIKRRDDSERQIEDRSRGFGCGVGGRRGLEPGAQLLPREPYEAILQRPADVRQRQLAFC